MLHSISIPFHLQLLTTKHSHLRPNVTKGLQKKNLISYHTSIWALFEATTKYVEKMFLDQILKQINYCIILFHLQLLTAKHSHLIHVLSTMVYTVAFFKYQDNLLSILHHPQRLCSS